MVYTSNRLTTEGLNNLPIGFSISANDVAELSGQNRVKGIHPIFTGRYKGVVILCTIGGENYPNQWLDSGKENLKYYLEGRTDSESGRKIFNRNIKTNKSIIDSRSLGYPILVFTRRKKGELFRFEGEFQYQRVVRESSGDEYFELSRQFNHNPAEPERVISEDDASSEGKKIIKLHLTRERDPKVIKKAIRRAKSLTGKVT